MCGLLSPMLAEKLDPLQFAYKAKRGVEDASLTLLDTVARQLDSTHPHTRILLMDFSSAFITVQTDILLHRLAELEVSPTLILWFKNFSTDRPQQVVVNGFTSSRIILNIGLPQGCVSSPLLFAAYTNHITCNRKGMALLKYADDMALVAHLTGADALAEYHQAADNLALVFQESSLELNTNKTKELCFGSREKADCHQPPLFQPLSINGQLVEQVQSFKYLGTEIDISLSFSQHTDSIFKEAHQRLHLLRKLRAFNVSKNILTLVYRSLIESILTFNNTSWYNSLLCAPPFCCGVCHYINVVFFCLLH